MLTADSHILKTLGARYDASSRCGEFYVETLSDDNRTAYYFPLHENTMYTYI